MGLSQLLVATASMAILTPGLATGIHGPPAETPPRNYCGGGGKPFDWVGGKPEPETGYELVCIECTSTDSITTSSTVTKSSSITSTIGVSATIPNFVGVSASLGITAGESATLSGSHSCNASALSMSLRFSVAIETCFLDSSACLEMV